jgi:Flp pilus assembly protein TadB
MFEKDEKNRKNNEVRYTSIGFGDLLALAFIILKLCGVISWPWVWVLAPIWIPLALVLGILIVFIIVLGISNLRK